MHSTAFTPAILGQPDLVAVDSIPSAILDPVGQARSRLGQPDVEALDSIPSAKLDPDSIPVAVVAILDAGGRGGPWTRSARRERRGVDPGGQADPVGHPRSARRGGPGLDLVAKADPGSISPARTPWS